MRLDERYIQLGLRIGRHVDGYVDAYFGPNRLKGRVEAEQLCPPETLVADAEALIGEIETAELEPQRRRWLTAQARAIHATARRLRGDEIGFLDEIELCFGVRPERVPEDDLAAAHHALDEALPGEGGIADRYAAWLQERVPGEQLLTALASISAELRARVADLFGLPAGEQVEYETVRDKPWTGFNYYEGGLRSRVAINLDLPLLRSDFVRFVAHETYPGHHTEHAWKELLYVRERDQLEQSIVLTSTPESIVSEGLAEFGANYLFPDVHELTQEHLARVGVEYEPEVGRRVSTARAVLGGIGTNVGLMLFEDGVPRDEARAYALEWSLSTRERVDKMLEFVTDPLWRTYAPSYDQGEHLCAAFIGDQPSRFKRLLTEQLTPADLALGCAGVLGEAHRLVNSLRPRLAVAREQNLGAGVRQPPQRVPRPVGVHRRRPCDEARHVTSGVRIARHQRVTGDEHVRRRSSTMCRSFGCT